MEDLNRSFLKGFLWPAILCLLALIILPFLGGRVLTPELIRNHQDLAYIFWFFRVPRVLISAIIGAILGLGGMTFQSVFANVLATPYTLGVSSAAACGALLSFALGWRFQVGVFDQVAVFAIGSALLSVLIIYGLARRLKFFETYKILLLGVAVNFFFTSLILYLQFQLDYLNSYKFLHWLIGSIQNISYELVWILASVLVAGVAYVFFMRRELDLLGIGEVFARSKGVNVGYVRWSLVLIASVMVGLVVSFFGPIAFVGMMVPNIARLLSGASHQRVIWSTVFIGSLIVMISDLLSRTLFSPVEIPLGIFTSLIGAVFFILLVLRR